MNWIKVRNAFIATGLAVLAAGVAAACGSTPAASTSESAPARSTPPALYEGSADLDGCIKLTEHGAEYLTNDGYSDTDYYPVGAWYAYRDSTKWMGYTIGGDVGPNVQGTAAYSTLDLNELYDVATLNTQADQAGQIEAYRDTWRDGKGMHPALSRWDSRFVRPDEVTPQLVNGLAGCFGDARTIDLNPVAAALAATGPTG